MKRVKYKKAFRKERTDRVDFRRRFYKVERNGMKITAMVRPDYFDDYGFLILVRYPYGYHHIIRKVDSFEKALDHVLILLTDVSLWSLHSNTDMY